MTPPLTIEHVVTHPLAPGAARAPAPAAPAPRRAVLAGLLERGVRTPWRLLADVVTLYAASLAALLADSEARITGESRALVIVFPLLVLGVMRTWCHSDRKLNISAIDAGMRVLGAVTLAAMVVIVFDAIVGDHRAVPMALRFWVFGFLLLGSSRVLFVSALRHARSNLTISTPTLIVGAGIVANQVIQRLAERPEFGLQPVGILDASPLAARSAPEILSVPLLGGPDNLARAAQQTGARHVILAFSSQRDHELVEVMRRCHELGLEVSLVPRFYEMVNERTTLEHVGGLPLLTVPSVDPKGWAFTIKHVLDRVGSLLALLLISPVLLALALAVRRSSPGPILLRQRRVGRDGRVFDLLKFRSMLDSDTLDSDTIDSFVPGAGSAPGGVEGVDRRTRVGRWLRATSLDELPQLINVLRGEMSLVGPRPERPEYVDQFATQIQRYGDRHRVKSGITGWAQVNGLRGQTSIADRVEWDNFYVRNWSPALDLRIIALTAIEVGRFRDR
jgi:exopolysaccharide biosynthesis polyprenyl glycosylphosphotransferase